MTRIVTGRAPYQKAEKVEPKTRKPMRRVSRKKAAQTQENAAYIAAVRGLPCCACGVANQSEAHHPRCKPPASEPHAYKRIPGAGIRSHDQDAIPLCRPCHTRFHLHRTDWVADHGPDYGFIPSTRAAVAAMIGEIEF